MEERILSAMQVVRPDDPYYSHMVQLLPNKRAPPDELQKRQIEMIGVSVPAPHMYSCNPHFCCPRDGPKITAPSKTNGEMLLCSFGPENLGEGGGLNKPWVSEATQAG